MISPSRVEMNDQAKAAIEIVQGSTIALARIGEAPMLLRAIDSARDEEERQAREKGQHKAEEIDPPAPRQGGEIGRRRGFGGDCLAQCAAPQWAPQPTSTSSGTSSWIAGSAA